MIAVGTGTWGIAAVIPKYQSLRLPLPNIHKTPEHLFRLSPPIVFFCLAMNAFVGNLVTLQPNKH